MMKCKIIRDTSNTIIAESSLKRIFIRLEINISTDVNKKIGKEIKQRTKNVKNRLRFIFHSHYRAQLVGGCFFLSKLKLHWVAHRKIEIFFFLDHPNVYAGLGFTHLGCSFFKVKKDVFFPMAASLEIAHAIPHVELH